MSRSLKVREMGWGVIYNGTREQLEQTGLFKAAWFPGEPGMRKWNSTIRDGDRKISIIRRTPRLFDAWWRYTPAEVAAGGGVPPVRWALPQLVHARGDQGFRRLLRACGAE
jgi:hypothetical protein